MGVVVGTHVISGMLFGGCCGGYPSEGYHELCFIAIIYITDDVVAQVHFHRGVVRPLSLGGQAVLLHLLHAGSADRNGTSHPMQYDIKNHKIFLKKIQYP